MAQRILIVDDEPLIREVLSQLLDLHGYATLTARDGQEALDLLRNDNQPTTVLLDVHMPVMTGAEFLAATRESMPALGPIIIMSACPPANIADDKRVTAVLTKPFHVEALLDALAQRPLGMQLT